ncbi:MAG: HlyD family efflux transporter periplasmic adaptor subunit [Gammaproteobacteria bacterium]|nr:HlyD family efflux transporter periplasmic adaptor subunit [Gammaproteobacteria bacterium]
MIYQSSSQSGTLQTLAIHRGQTVKTGDLLFTLDPYPQSLQLEQAQAELAGAEATLHDMELGLRPDEIKEIEADIASTKAAIDYYQKEVKRYESLAQLNYAPKSTYDEKYYQYHQNKAQLERLQASLNLGHLGNREYVIATQKEAIDANQKNVASMQWNVSQKTVSSAGDGIIVDTYYQPGEWVNAGQAVTSLQTPENVYVIFFVGEAELSRLHIGDTVMVKRDNHQKPVSATVSYMSSEAEYTPPVIYSESMRKKLVYEIKASFNNDIALEFHPGQPVDVTFHGE